MKITLWGTRGSLACSGPETEKYGGNTSCVEVLGKDGTLLIIDAGTGIRRLGIAVENKIKQVHILLSHLHLDHIQGLGFFAPLYDATVEVHVYGPAQTSHHLRKSLTKYLSPPLFPVLLSDLPCQLHLHAIGNGEFTIGQFNIMSQFVCHPGRTLGYRISTSTSSMAYLSDHEPALATSLTEDDTQWLSGYALAKKVDLLIHDAQYTLHEYEERIGWGHSTIKDAIEFARRAKVKTLVTFHHDPAHQDNALDMLLAEIIAQAQPAFKIYAGYEGKTFQLP